MSLKISVRRQYLADRKAQGNRVTIGFAGIADLRSFIGLEYLKGMTRACIDYDINFINMGGAIKYSLFDDMHFIQNYIKNFKFMKTPFIDGLVTWTSSFWDFMKQDKIIETFSSLAPLPMVDIGHMNIPHTTHLKINSPDAIHQLMNHLVKDHGYTKFAFFGADVTQPHWNRLFTYQSDLKKYGISELPGSVYMAKSMSINHLAEKVDEMLKKHSLKDKKEIECIVTTTDIIAAELIELLNARGVSVPKDVAVTGFNNWYEGITSRSPLTTIDLSYYERGYAAIEVLIDRLASGEQKEETLLFNTKLVIRQSCGCLEKGIQTAGCEIQNSSFDFSRDYSEIELREYITSILSQIFRTNTTQEINSYVDYFLHDLYSRNEESRLLQWAQNEIQNIRKAGNFDPDYFQDCITKFRNSILPFLKSEGIDALLRMENIFHQMRSLVSVFQKYESLADRENPYQVNNITERAVSFVTATSIEEVYQTLENQLAEFDIPGAVLALSDTPTPNFPSPEIKFFYPEPTEEQKRFLGSKIDDPSLFPKVVFPQDRRYSMMLEVLHSSNYYFGYAFFEMKKENIATYDVLRMLLSNTIYSMFKETGKLNLPIQPTQQQISSLISPSNSVQDKRARLTAEQISEYLTGRLNEMTNVEKMADYFMVSKSYLSKKTKELTGYTIQQLHEKLKIEQAKNMLLLNTFELSKIARDLGFDNQNYFSNVFKKNTGLSPKNWLKQQ